MARFMMRLLMILIALSTTTAHAEMILLGTGQISGTATDDSGLSEKFETGDSQNLLGGISAIEYTGKDNLYFALPDRGPDDGAVPWKCRVQTIRIDIHPKQAPAVVPSLVSTTMLTDETERNFIGKSTAHSPSSKFAERFDPEGIRLAQDGTFYISDEYGPQLIRFSLEGKAVKRISVPAHFLITHPGSSKTEENGANQIGRSANRGMEGLAISKDGKIIVGLMQSPLLQDSARTAEGKPTGLNCRLLVINLETGTREELLYHLEHPKNKLNEILAINDHDFLVIERDGNAGEEANFKKIFKIDLSRATDIQKIKSLPPENIPTGVLPVQKEVFIDLLNPAFSLAGKKMPEKIEGLTFGPVLPDGKQTLIVATDNDFEADSPSLFYAFSFDQSDLN